MRRKTPTGLLFEEALEPEADSSRLRVGVFCVWSSVGRCMFWGRLPSREDPHEVRRMVIEVVLSSSCPIECRWHVRSLGLLASAITQFLSLACAISRIAGMCDIF